jgi:hypothetical protein
MISKGKSPFDPKAFLSKINDGRSISGDLKDQGEVQDHDSFKAVREEEKRALEDLACTWTKAALASDRIFGPSTTSSPPAGWPTGRQLTLPVTLLPLLEFVSLFEALFGQSQ